MLIERDIRWRATWPRKTTERSGDPVISASRTRRTEKTLEIFARLENQSGTTSKWEMSATEITGDDIKAWRARKALTQAMAARRLGLAKATLQDWERGRRTPGITRGVGPEQFRRVVRTIFHTWDPKSSSVKERITLEILSTGQPRAYADSIYRGIFTIEWQGWRALQDWERGRRMWSSRAATLKSFGKALGSRWSVRSVNKPTVLGPERPTIGWRAPATSFEILVFRNSLGPLSRPRRLRWEL